MNETNLIKQVFELKKENFELKKDNQILKKQIKKTTNLLSFANNRIKQLENKIENMNKKQNQLIEDSIKKATKKVIEKLEKEHKKEVDELKGKISRLEKRLNTDSSNSSTPTSKDRIGKHKIQNNREVSCKEIGAQPGHEIHKLDYFKENEITETIEHTLDCCPNCGGELIETNIVKSDIIDIKVTVTKTRNNIHNYKCKSCKKNISANSKLPRGASYGENIDAVCLSLMNESNTPLNKITSFISGITNNEINISEGYLIKVQKKSSKKLKKFTNDLREKVISLKKLFWDDTTIKFGMGKSSEGYDEKDIEYLAKIEKDEKKDKKYRNGIIRFYGDDKWAYLVGHRFKNGDGIDDDCILSELKEDCVVMHDHVLLNYNEKYSFKNAECNEHARRYLKGITDMFPTHTWAKQMRDFLTELNIEKQKAIDNKETKFTEERINEIFNKYNQIIKLGYKENESVDLAYILNKNDELNLIERLDKYRENHLMFITDFSVDFTNNTSEKGLRQVKRKIAVSFMFKNSNRMKDYATILSYFETCYRHGISRFDASKRLVSENPYTIEELEKIEKGKTKAKNVDISPVLRGTIKNL